MRAGGIGFGRPWRWATALALLTLLVCASVAGIAWAAGTQASPAGSPAEPPLASTSVASPSAAQSPTQLGDTPSPAPTIVWTIAPAAVVYGQTVTAQGTVTPATAGRR